MTKLLLRLFLNKEDLQSARGRTRVGVLSSSVGIACNVLLSALKFVLGMVSGSIAVTADAFNNLSDVGSSVVTLIGFKMASKPADRDHPFGHGRLEYLSGLVVALLILVVGVEIGKSSIEKIISPEPVEFSFLVAAGLVASILVKLWMGLFNKKLGGIIGSAAMQAVSADSLTDVCATSATLISVIAARFTALPVDGVMGLVVAGFILYSGYGVVKDTLDPLLGQKPDPELVRQITELLLAYPGILGIHDLMVHDYGPARRMASVHAEVSVHSDILASHDVIDRAEREIAQRLGIDIVVHMDPIETDCEKTNELRALASSLVREIDPAFSIHDFRIVCGGALTNFIFDVMVPYEFGLSDEVLLDRISAAFQAVDANYTAVVNIDRSFCG